MYVHKLTTPSSSSQTPEKLRARRLGRTAEHAASRRQDSPYPTRRESCWTVATEGVAAMRGASWSGWNRFAPQQPPGCAWQGGGRVPTAPSPVVHGAAGLIVGEATSRCRVPCHCPCLPHRPRHFCCLLDCLPLLGSRIALCAWGHGAAPPAGGPRSASPTAVRADATQASCRSSTPCPHLLVHGRRQRCAAVGCCESLPRTAHR